jgi:hypothetical protein
LTGRSRSGESRTYVFAAQKLFSFHKGDIMTTGISFIRQATIDAVEALTHIARDEPHAAAMKADLARGQLLRAIQELSDHEEPAEA